MMFKKKLSIRKPFFLLKRAVFHHGGPEHPHSHPPQKPKSPEQAPNGEPEGFKITQPEKSNSAEGVRKREHMSPVEAKEALKYRHKPPTREFVQNPEMIASEQHIRDFFSGKTNDYGQIWRFLSVPEKMKFHLIPAQADSKEELDRLRCIFLRDNKPVKTPHGHAQGHRDMILMNYKNKVSGFSKETPTSKQVPYSQPPVEGVPAGEIPEGMRVIAFGDSQVSQLAQHANTAGKMEYITNDGHPRNSYQTLKAMVESGKSLEGATLILSIAPEHLGDSANLAELGDAVTDFLKLAKSKGAKVVVPTPRPTMVRLLNNPPTTAMVEGVSDPKRAKKNREDFMNFLAKQYQGGLIDVMMDNDFSTQQLRGDSNSFKIVHYADQSDLSKGYSERGAAIASAGLVNAVLLANDETNSRFSAEQLRTSADPERHFYGMGDTYDESNGYAPKKHEKTIDLIPGARNRLSIQQLPENVREAIISVSYLVGGLDLVKIPEASVRQDIATAYALIDRELTDPKMRSFARLQVQRDEAQMRYVFASKELTNKNYQSVADRVEEARRDPFWAQQSPPKFRVYMEQLEGLAQRGLDGEKIDWYGPFGLQNPHGRMVHNAPPQHYHAPDKKEEKSS